MVGPFLSRTTVGPVRLDGGPCAHWLCSRGIQPSLLDVSASPDGVRSTRSLEGSTFTVSATKTTLELHDDPAILNGNVRYRQTHAGGTHTIGASATGMSL